MTSSYEVHMWFGVSDVSNIVRDLFDRGLRACDMGGREQAKDHPCPIARVAVMLLDKSEKCYVQGNTRLGSAPTSQRVDGMPSAWARYLGSPHQDWSTCHCKQHDDADVTQLNDCSKKSIVRSRPASMSNSRRWQVTVACWTAEWSVTIDALQLQSSCDIQWHGYRPPTKLLLPGLDVPVPTKISHACLSETTLNDNNLMPANAW